MTLAELIRVLLAAVVFAAALAGLSVLCALVFPRLVARARSGAERMPRRSLAIGLANLLFFGLISAALLNAQPLALLGVLLATALLSLMAIGLAAVAAIVGDRLAPASGPLRRLSAGTLLLCLASLTPVVGWFAVAPLALLIGFGAVIAALLQRRPPLDEPPPAP